MRIRDMHTNKNKRFLSFIDFLNLNRSGILSYENAQANIKSEVTKGDRKLC